MLRQHQNRSRVRRKRRRRSRSRSPMLSRSRLVEHGHIDYRNHRKINSHKRRRSRSNDSRRSQSQECRQRHFYQSRRRRSPECLRRHSDALERRPPGKRIEFYRNSFDSTQQVGSKQLVESHRHCEIADEYLGGGGGQGPRLPNILISILLNPTDVNKGRLVRIKIM